MRAASDEPPNSSSAFAPVAFTQLLVEPPEKVAALERGNSDIYAMWEPWVMRARRWQEQHGAHGPGRNSRAGRLHLHEQGVDPEETGAGRGFMRAQGPAGEGRRQAAKKLSSRR